MQNVEHLCSKCGTPHNRWKDRGKTRPASYCQACHATYMREHRPKHHELTPVQRFKANARAYAKVYKERGLLAPMPCEKCGDPEAEMHHEDYSKPLVVRWMCRECHLTEHYLERMAAAA